MAETQAGSTVPRRQLGRYLAALRVQAGLSVRAAAKAMDRSEPTLWRIETGKTSTRVPEVEAMCKLYKADAEMTATLAALAKETKAKGWWQAYGDVVPEWFDLYVGLEAAAVSFKWYETELVPGLFQTRAYARALIETDSPELDENEIERRVQLKIERQAILNRPVECPELQVAIGETVLWCPVGGPEVMAEQLDALVKASEDLPNVELRVVPFGAGMHLGKLAGPFEILRFPLNGGGEEKEPPTVYSDRFAGALYLDKPGEVARYDRTFGSVWESSLDAKESRELIRKAAEGLRHG